MHKHGVLTALWGAWGGSLYVYAVYDTYIYLLLVPVLFPLYWLMNIMFKKKVHSMSDASLITNMPCSSY